MTRVLRIEDVIEAITMIQRYPNPAEIGVDPTAVLTQERAVM